MIREGGPMNITTIVCLKPDTISGFEVGWGVRLREAIQYYELYSVPQRFNDGPVVKPQTPNRRIQRTGE